MVVLSRSIHGPGSEQHQKFRATLRSLYDLIVEVVAVIEVGLVQERFGAGTPHMCCNLLGDPGVP